MDKKISFNAFALKYILLGCAAGTAVFFEPSLLFILSLVLGMVFLIRSADKEDTILLTKVVIAAFIARFIVFIIVMFYVYVILNLNYYQLTVWGKVLGHSVQVFRDFGREIINGKLIGRYFSGEFGNVPIQQISSEGRGYLHFGAYFQGTLNFLFGENILNLFSLPVISLSLVILIYRLAKEVFDRRTAVVSSLMVALVPSFNIWACSNIRTTLGIAGLVLMGYCLMLFSKKNNIKFILPLIISIFIFSVVKEKFLRPALLIMCVSLFLSFNIRMRLKMIIMGLAVLALIIGINVNGAFEYLIKDILGDMVACQSGFFSDGSISNYKIYNDAVYSVTTVKTLPFWDLAWLMIKGLPKGVLYFLFSPFPWDIKNTLRLFAYPQIIFWYLMFVFASLGIIKAALLKNHRILSSIYIISFFTILFSLVMGNEGITARFRDMLTPFFYMFAGYLLCGWFCPTKKNQKAEVE